MTKFLNLMLILLLFSSCDDILTTSSKEADSSLTSKKMTDTLHMELTIESEHISSLADIKAQFKLTNLSVKEVIYGFTSGCKYGYTVTKNEKTLFDSQKNLACTAALTEIRLKLGETKTFPISFHIFDINKKLDKGIYELNAFLLENHTPEISALFEVK